jgi:hypothetical protein
VLRAGYDDAVDDYVGDLVAMIGGVKLPIDPDRRNAVDLDPARYDPTFLIGLLVPAAVAAARGLKFPASAVSAEHVANALSGKHLLLVLDNCEHVIAHDALDGLTSRTRREPVRSLSSRPFSAV